MKLWTRWTVVVLTALLATIGVHARPGGSGSGGGRGGSGGHGGREGFSSGPPSGRSSGRGVGHAIGRSFGHLFGRHGKDPSYAHDMASPLADATVQRGKVLQFRAPQIVSSPAQRRFLHRPINDFPFGERFLFFPPRSGFGFGGCADFGFPRYRFFFDDDFNCFGGGLFLDPFFIVGFSRPFIDGSAFLPFNDRVLDNVPDDSSAAPRAEASPAQPAVAADLSKTGGSTQNAESNNAASADRAKSEPPVTLLQLRDGSMYGLVDYWFEDGELHYTTSYGGQNSLGLDRIDLEKTVQLNTDRGIRFVLLPKTPPR